MSMAADEKRAFDLMMAEIDSDDNSDPDINDPYAKPTPTYASAKYTGSSSSAKSSDSESSVKSPSRNGPYRADSKPYPSSSSNNGNRYKKSKEEEEIENFGKPSFNSYGGSGSQGSGASDKAPGYNSDISISKRWLSKPCSYRDQTLKCYITREKGTMTLQPTVYRCFLEFESTDDESDDERPKPPPQGRFMMSAKKKIVKRNGSSYYLISLDYDPNLDDRGSESMLGKMRGNNVGNRYLVTDHGLPPEKTVVPSMRRKEHGVVSFEFDSGGPSKIECHVPYVSASGLMSVWQPESEEEGLERCVESFTGSVGAGAGEGIGIKPESVEKWKDNQKLFLLRNKQPKWDEAHGGHVLNFQGRVTESSVKNFQLVCREVDLHSDPQSQGPRSAYGTKGPLVDPEEIVLQFGRVGKQRFTMDFKFPLSPLQAFSICVACLDGKLADRKGYEYINKIGSGTAEVVDWSYGKLTSMLSGRPAQSEDEEGDLFTKASGPSSNGNMHAQGSVKGSTSIVGSVQESLPSSQYLRDKLSRSISNSLGN